MRQLCLAMFAVWFLMIAYFNYLLADGTDDANDPPCYLADRKSCPNDGSICRVNKTADHTLTPTMQIYCCNITNLEQVEAFLEKFNEYNKKEKLTGLHVRDSNFASLNLNFFGGYLFRDLTSLSITDSNIGRVSRGFEIDRPNLACLDMSNNTLKEFETLHLFGKLDGLRKLVLANITNMTTLPHIPFNPGLLELDVSNNPLLECKYLINITHIIFHKLKFLRQLNKNSTVCEPPNKVFHSTVLVKMNEIDKVKDIFTNCPSGKEKCVCEVASLDDLGDGHFVYHALVNCSGRQLTSLPTTLPPFTLVLDVSHNSITSLDGIKTNLYSGIKALNADYNNITTIKDLEGSAFLESFQNLSLRYNKITYIPRNILTNVFDRSPNSAKTVLLAKNNLECNCVTATEVKTWLQTVAERVPDYRELLAICSNAPIPVADMNAKDYCPTHSFQHYLKFIIAAEITLFVLLVAKVSYDYYIFKTAGYLPWPASKMPKLPCDWCFET